jgi:hypothetical protein
LNSPSLAAEEALKIAVEIATGAKKPADYPPESFTKAVGIGARTSTSTTTRRASSEPTERRVTRARES